MSPAARGGRAVVVTTINPPTPSLRTLAGGLDPVADRLIVVGDTKSPVDFALPGARFLSVDEQVASGLGLGRACPTRHYARKNIGYLWAIRDGAGLIQETDDDNAPGPGFFLPVEAEATVPVIRGTGWSNLYRYFSDLAIWPRGLPLGEIHRALPAFEALPVERVATPIRQGLADGDPDVDAIFRLVSPAEVRFRDDRQVAAGRGAWCPFNSQNTVWFPDAFPLLYLPAHCSFRMTDIWRSFVAQRIAWENDWTVLFHAATVWQARNEHDLMIDFADEVPGYLNNARIAAALDALTLAPGPAAMADNLLRCYSRLIELGVVADAELSLLRCWLADLGL